MALLRLGGASVETGDGAQTILTICDDTRGVEDIQIRYKWVHPSPGTLYRLHLEFNGGAITGSGYFRSFNSSAGPGSASGNVALLDEGSIIVTTGNADISATAGTEKHMRTTAHAGRSPFASGDVFVKALVATWTSTTDITSIRVRATTAANVNVGGIGEGSRFDVYAVTTDSSSEFGSDEEIVTPTIEARTLRLQAPGRVSGLADSTTQLQLNKQNDLLRELREQSIIGGHLLQNIALTAGTRAIVRHGLGRKYRGWSVVDKSTDSNVYAEATTRPESELWLQASNDTTVSIWVF